MGNPGGEFNVVASNPEGVQRFKSKSSSFTFTKCGNIPVAVAELKGCQDSTKSDLVLEDVGVDVVLKCVNEY